MNKIQLLRSVPLFALLSNEDLARLAVSLGTQTFERGETICHQGSTGNVIYLIVEGQVRIYRTNEAGQELSVRILRGGDFFGELSLLDGQPRMASVEAMRRTTTLMLHRDAFLCTVEEHPQIAVSILKTLSARFRHITLYAENLASHTAVQRVVRQLLDLAIQHGVAENGATRIDLHLTQDDLASLSGTTRETVNRVLAALREEGLVRVERARISVLNLLRLESALEQL
jgi:CRP-like cAMP-binding protein